MVPCLFIAAVDSISRPSKLPKPIPLYMTDGVGPLSLMVFTVYALVLFSSFGGRAEIRTRVRQQKL
jgi:hypothetical protein